MCPPSLAGARAHQVGRQLFIVFVLRRQTRRWWKGDAQKDGEPGLADKQGCSLSRWGEAQNLGAWPCLFPLGAAGPLVPGCACTSRRTRFAGMGAGPAALGASSCSTREPEALGRMGPVAGPAHRQVCCGAGVKCGGWRSVHWRGDWADWGRLFSRFCPTGMDTRCVWGGAGSRLGFPVPARMPLPFFLLVEMTPERSAGSWAVRPGPQNLKPGGYWERFPQAPSGAVMPGPSAPLLQRALAVLSEAVGLGGADLGSLRAAAPSQNHASLLPPIPNPGQAAFHPFLFLVFPSCQ